MIYLDTGCLVKLYYPEPDSAQIVAHVSGKPICYTPLHALEFINALQLKVFFRAATPEQVAAARAMVQADLDAGVLLPVPLDWTRAFQDAEALAAKHTDTFGCRSLDILHCAAAKIIGCGEFVSTDARQKGLAQVIGLKLLPA